MTAPFGDGPRQLLGAREGVDPSRGRDMNGIKWGLREWAERHGLGLEKLQSPQWVMEGEDDWREKGGKREVLLHELNQQRWRPKL